MKNKQVKTSSLTMPWPAQACGRLLAWFFAFALLLGASTSLQAQTTNLWIATNQVWNVAGNWSPANIPNAVDTSVTFNNTTNSINNPGSLVTNTIGSLILTATSATIGLAGPNLVLNLQSSSGMPVINCSGGAGLYWYFTTTGTQGFLKLGSGLLTSRFGSAVNPITGPIIIGGGGLQLQTAAQVANASSLTISNAAGSGLSLNNSANGSATGFDNIYTILPASLPVNLEGGGVVVLQSGQVGQTMTIKGNVQTASGSAVYYKGPGQFILAGTNNFVGNSTVSGGTIDFSTTTTNNGTLIVSANATNGVIATSPANSMVVSSLTLLGTNNSVLAFGAGASGSPTVPMLNITNQLTFVTNIPTPIVLSGGGWQTGSAIPLLKYGTLINTNAAGVFGSFALGTLPQGFTAALVDGTSTNQINLNLSAIVPLVWSPATANTNWTAANNWSLSGTGNKTYTEANLMGSAVQFDDTLPPAGPSIVVTNNSILSPNNVTFNNSTHNYTLLGSGGIADYAGITKGGTGYLTNSLANTYFGNTVLNGGVMVLNNATALGYGSMISFNGGTLQFSANNKNDYSGQFSTAVNQAYSLNLGGQSISLSNALASSGGTLTVSGTGTLTLGAACSYTGATTNTAGTLKLGIANGIPTSSALTLGSSGTSAIFDLAGNNQQLTGLVMASGATGAIITNSSAVIPVTLQFNGGTSSFGGKVVDGTAGGAKSLALTVSSGSLTLNGVNTYTGNTTITNNSALIIGNSIASTNIIIGTGSLLDVSAISYVMPANCSLSGVGTVNGGLEAASTTQITAGYAGNHGTLTFSNASSTVTLDTGARCAFNVATTSGSASNDKIAVNGQLNVNGNTLSISALSGAANLDTVTDYTLISSPNTTISGSFNSVPNWLGTKPLNYAHYTVVTSANTVTLHYSTGVLLSGAGAVSPVSGVHQPYLFTVLVTPGTGSTGIGVTADFSTIGDTVETFSGVGSLYSYTYQVPSTLAPGTYSIPFTVTDAQSDTYTANISVTIGNGTLTWNGLASDNNWSNTNWLNGATPDTSGDAGDALLFAGTTRLSPVMNSSYNVTAVTFSNNAGAFNVSSTGGTLTLSAGGAIENDSTTAQSLEVPIALTASGQFRPVAGNLTVGAISGTGSITNSGPGKLIIDGALAGSSYSGNTIINGGTLAITNADNVLPTTTVAFKAAATLDLGNQSQNLANLTSALGVTNYVKNGNLTETAVIYNPFSGLANSSTLDMSGLANFTLNTFGNFYPQGSVNTGVNLSQTFTTYLAGGTNFILVNLFLIGQNGGTNIPNSNVYLGQANTIYANTIQLSAYRGNGNVYFESGLTSSNLTLRAADGGSRVGTMTIGAFSSGVTVGSTMDLGAANVDALVDTLTVCSSTLGSGVTQTGTLNFGNGNFDITTLNLAQSTSVNNPAATLVANFNQTGGTNTVTTINMGQETSTGYPLYKPTYTVGKGATLIAASITGGLGLNYTNGSIRSLNLNGGTVAVNPSVSELQIIGADGGSGGVINIVLGAGTTNTFFADIGLLIDTINAPVSGAGTLNKTGAGTLELDDTNTYTGNTIVNGGTLDIKQPTLSYRSTVTVATNAVLQMDFTVTNRVAVLVINGISKAPGVYNNSTDPTYLTGTGNLLVVPLNTNAFLSSLALNPTDNLNPGFTTNGFVYYATNTFGSTPTVTVANSDLTASNILFVNGQNFQVLTSGVPSLPLNNLGLGSTNVLKVLVTAQDGVTTNLYTVNLTQLVMGTTTAVTSSVNPSLLTSNVTFTATIAPTSGVLVPVGAVQFKTNGVNLGSPVAVTTGVSPNGTASITTSALPVGTSTVTAEFTSNGSFANSTNTLSGGQVVNAPVTTPPNFSGGGISVISGGGISLVSTGAIGGTYKLWASTNLALTPFTNYAVLLHSGTVTTSPFTNTDLTATNYPQRFYLFTTP